MSKHLAWPKKHKWLVAFVIGTLIAIGLVLYLKPNSSFSRQDFEQARSDIDAIYADIVSQIGEPDNQKSSNTCSSGYSGPYNLITDCIVRIDFVYGVKDQQAATSLSKRIENLIKSHPDLLKPGVMKGGENPNTPAASNYSDSSLSLYKSNSNLDCSFGYSYNRTDDKTDLVLKDTSNGLKKFSAAISCIGEAESEIFPAPTAN